MKPLPVNLPCPADVDPARDPVAFLSAEELARSYSAGRLSPVEVTAHLLDRIERIELSRGAFYDVCRAGALAEARASEARWSSGKPRSLLDGVPVSIKDHLELRGHCSPRGVDLARARPVDIDCPPAARLREAGVVFLGKTTMPELSVIPVTHTAAFGVARNPWNPAFTSGGSSGGAATAVAAGLGPIAIGSDGGGSIRLPAAFTGLVGHKPTLGRVPYFPGQTDRTTAGPLARTVRDAALVMNCIARPDGRDWMELPADPTDYLAGIEDGVSGLRVAFSPTYGYENVRADVAQPVGEAIRRLADAGARVVVVERVCSDPFEHYMAQACLRLRGRPREPGMPRAVTSVLERAERLTPEDLQAMLDARNQLGREMLDLFRGADVLVSPTSPVPAPAVGELYPDTDTLGEANRNLIGFTAPVNLVHMPAISVPCGFTAEGLPVGLQIAGPKFSDALLLRVALAVERAMA